MCESICVQKSVGGRVDFERLENAENERKSHRPKD